MITIEKEAAAAAKWWADQIRNGADLDNGEPMHGAFGKMLQRREDPAMIDAFEAILAQKIVDRFGPSASEAVESGDPLRGGYYRTIDVDYHPDPILSESANEAGIRPTMTTFPWKTVMSINAGDVKVGAGYGNGLVTIYESRGFGGSVSKDEKTLQVPWISAQSAIGGIVAIIFALIAMAALYFYFLTPVIPPIVESYQTVTFREIGGNGAQLFGLCLLAIGAGICSVIGLCAVITDRSYDRRW